MDNLKFEEALSKLEDIVRQLESGETPLDESLQLFEDGVKLARICNKKLDEAEAKVQILMGEEKDVSLETFEVKD
ncbi:MAG: exodeoxyribonuclease VII small subunit [Firmicutes bacterium]|jgi:exodeoxyribonuclease VII small subunit|nr:exodeoxyribonuclease VII small subunit [Bacillota bacterium]